MTTRPRASLVRILEDLGTTLLEPVAGETDRAEDISGVVIYDPLDEPVPPPRAIVLGVGIHGTTDVAQLLDVLGRLGAAGLVVRAPAPLDDAVDRSGVALLGLTRGATWAQLAAVIRSLIFEGDVGEPGAETLGGIPSGDLFALANAIAALLDAPVTIEDRSSRVLAFSGRQDEADPSRVETILGRQVPERYARMLEERGVFQAMYRSDQPVHVDPTTGSDSEFELPRAAIAVRAGDEILGSIWAAVRTRLSAERAEALRDAAKLVALHMMRLRAGADVERRLRADLLGLALEGGPGAADAVRRLGLASQPAVVLALTLLETPGEPSSALHAQLVAERERVADAFAMHLSAVHPRSAAGLIGDVAYGVVPVSRDDADTEGEAVRLASDFLSRIAPRLRPLVGVGPLAADVTALARSRAAADRTLRVLSSGTVAQPVARFADVYIEALLLELADLAAERGDPPTGPVSRLIEYDTRHRTRLADTLRAWLDSFGDVISASAAMYVHPNTFRYRLRRLASVSSLDLTDANARFAAMLELRLQPHR